MFLIHEPGDLNAAKGVTHFYDIPEFAEDEYVFAGWYHNPTYTQVTAPDSTANMTPVDFERDTYTKANPDGAGDPDHHLYAKWIKVGTVDKASKDTNIISSYRGFGLAGVQIRPKAVKVKDPVTGEYIDAQMYDPNHRNENGTQYNDAIVATPEGLRFMTSLSENLLSSINGIQKIPAASQEAQNFGVEYGYAMGTENNINAFINHYRSKISDTAKYTLQYNGQNVNGKNTTGLPYNPDTATPETDYRYITNVNCTSKQGAGTKNKNPGIVMYDHRNFDTYSLYTLVVTYDDAASKDKLNEKIDARAYIRYYDANGKLRVFYNIYNKDMYYGGCMCSFNQVSSIAMGTSVTEG